MTCCNRCGKPLTNQLSLRRGYGPVCWGKINGKFSKEQRETMERGEREENNYPEILDYWGLMPDRRCFCGADIKLGEIGHYAHDGGYPLNGWKENQWLFMVCPNCGYEYSFRKLRVPTIEVMEEVIA